MSCNNGSVLLYKYDRRQERLMLTQQWPTLHGHQVTTVQHGGQERGGNSCTSVSISQDGSVVTAGEDNKICKLSVESTTPLQTIGKCIDMNALYK